MPSTLFTVNPKYKCDEFLRQFFCNYSPTAKNWSSGGCSLLNKPFPVASCTDFIQPIKLENDVRSTQELVDAIESEVHQLSFKHRENDLFSFNQSIDVSTLQSDSYTSAEFPLLKEFRSFMLSDVLTWMKTITGAPLDNTKIDLTASIYNQTDVLLCHDDELEGRRIAFIWYLVPDDWDSKVDGGCLQLFDCKKTSDGVSGPTVVDGHWAPWSVSASLPPARNMLVFFEVSDLSYHQVAEILGYKARVSLHGWFHGPPLRTQPTITQCVPLPSPISPVSIEEDLVYLWLNPIYLDMEEQAKIRRRFRRTSEIQLAHFLKADKWTELSRQLALTPESTWCFCGPMNRKHYGILANDPAQSDDTGSEALRQLHRLFSSEAMQVILSDLTGVALHPFSSSENANRLADSEPPPVKRAHLDKGAEKEIVSSPPVATLSEVGRLCAPRLRRWQPGCYTLLADTDVGFGSRWRLETVLHIAGYGGQTGKGGGADGWQASWGGQLIYIASGDQNELLTVEPKDNCLTLVYTGPGTASFVKYINHTAVPIAVPPSSPSTSSTVADEPEPAAAAFDLSVIFYEPGGVDHDNDDDGDDGESGGDSLEDGSDEKTDEGDDDGVETESQASTDNSQG